MPPAAAKADPRPPAAPPPPPPPAAPAAGPPPARRLMELRVSGHMMLLDTGLFCVFHAPGSPRADAATGLPGVRISTPPGLSAEVEISTFAADGWLSGNDDAALVRVPQGPASILVTVYQPAIGNDAAPRLQVLQISGGGGQPQAAPLVAGPGGGAPAAAPPAEALADGVEVMAHIQRMGDVPARLGDWVGERGSQRWIEGFSITPGAAVAAEDLEYQAVLGRGWLSPWSKGGEFCGSRGMALPILGLRVRLRGAAAEALTVTCAASFIDGAHVGPVAEGEACEAESLSPLEAFQVVLQPRAPAAARPAARPGAGKPAKGAAKAPIRPTAKPTAKPAGKPVVKPARPRR